MSILTDGVGDQLYYSGTIFDWNSEYTVLWWTYRTATAFYGTFCSVTEAVSGSNYDWLGSNNSTGMALDTSGGSSGSFVNDVGLTPSLTTWYHMGIVRASATEIKAVLDGTYGSTSAGGNTSGRVAADRFTFGSQRSTADNLNASRFTHIKVWEGVALTEAEIALEMHTIRPQVHLDSLWGWWPVLLGSDRLKDYSGNGRDLSELSTPPEADNPPVSWGAPIWIVQPVSAGGGPVSLTVQDAAHSHSVDNAALTQHNALAAQDAAHSHSVDNVALTQHNALTVADAAHSHSADAVTLVQHYVLAANDALHAHAVDNAVLTQHYVLAVADALHGHTVDNVTLTVAGVLEVQDSAHTHTVDNVALVQHYIVTVADALHSHAADNVTLAIAGQLTVQEATHAHSADNVTLTQHNVLAVADALHSHTVDALALTVQLVVQDALHAHSVDNVVLASSLQLTVQDATHAHTVDSVALTQHHALTVADALHAHTADNVGLDIGAAFVVMAVVSMRFTAQGNVEMRFTAQEDVEL